MRHGTPQRRRGTSRSLRTQSARGWLCCLPPKIKHGTQIYIFDLVNTVHVHTDASLASCPHVFSFFCLGGGLGGLIVVFPFAFSWSTSNFSLSTVHIIIDLARSEGAKALLSITEPHGVKGIIRLDIRGHFDRRLGAVNLSLHLLGRAVVLVPELVLS